MSGGVVVLAAATGAAGICIAKVGLTPVKATAAEIAMVATLARKPSIYISIPWLILCFKITFRSGDWFPSVQPGDRCDLNRAGAPLQCIAGPLRAKASREATIASK